MLGVNMANAGTLHVKVENLANICPSETALACLDYNQNTIHLSESLNPEVTRVVFTHELGHWFMRDVKDYSVFGTGTTHELEELAANKFDSFVWYDYILTEKEKTFFSELIKGQDIDFSL